LIIDGATTVTDMLAAMLNVCSQEELNESTEKSASSVIPLDSDNAERRKAIKNVILAVGRISRIYSVLRCAAVVHFLPAPT
jgi:serine/threonine-protein phosphatase 2B catalytic subunit